MKKNLLLALTCLTQLVWAQPDFQRLYQPAASSEALANSIQPTAGGGFILAGRDSASAAQGYDAYLLKIAPNGDTIWARSYGTSADEYGQYAIESNDGGYMLVGITIGIDVNVYIVRANANGDTLWTRILGMPGDNEANFVQQTNDGNFIVAGYTSGSGAGSYDYFLMKIDNNGTVLWSKTYGTALDELAYTVFQGSDKGYIVAGAAMTPAGNIDVYAVKTDSMGVEQWSKYYGTIDTDWGYMMRPTSDGGYILTGYVANSGGGTDALLIKTNSSGDTLWTGVYGSLNFEQGLSVVQTTNGDYAVSGSVYYGSQGGSDAMLLRTDNAGRMRYCHGFGGIGDDWSQSLLQTGDQAFAMGGYSNTFSGGKYNFYLVRTDTAGNTVANCNEINTAVIQTQASISTTTLTTTVLPLTMNLLTGVTLVDSMMKQAEGCSSLSVHSVSGNRFSLDIFPNPSNGTFSVKVNQVQQNQVQLVVEDMLGNEVYSEVLQSQNGSISSLVRLENVVPGTYFVRLQAGMQSCSGKLIVLK